MQCNLRLFQHEIKQRKINLLCYFFIYNHIPTISHPLCTFFNQVLHMWYTVNCLDLPPLQLCTLYLKAIYNIYLLFYSKFWKISINSLIDLKNSSRFAGKEPALMTLVREVVTTVFKWRQSSLQFRLKMKALQLQVIKLYNCFISSTRLKNKSTSVI